MPRFTARERREHYLREYEFQKKTGKQFFPYAILHDTITSLAVVFIIIGLAIIWHSGFHAAGHDPNAGRDGGILGPAYEDRADPGTDSYDPRPEWYFFFLFQLLREFSNPNLILFGTIIIPTIWMVLLIAWPFLDRRPERRVSRRPVAMVIGACVPCLLLWLTWKGSAAPAVAGQAVKAPGVQVVTLNCGSCHTLAEAGITGNVGPNLDNAQPDFARAVDRLTNGKGGMPSFKKNNGWTDVQIQCIAGFIATYAGGNGKPGPHAGTAKNYPASCQQAGADFAATG
jgi:mono/diheme cytochrome c family protein